MKECKLTVKMRVYQWEELSEEQQKVVRIAKEQVERSYCPYSHFHVGAAALLSNGEIIRGCNQENAAYPSGLCAERSSLFAAGAQYPDSMFYRRTFHGGTRCTLRRMQASDAGKRTPLRRKNGNIVVWRERDLRL